MANAVASAKNILKSKTFWFNLITAAVHYSGFLPISPASTYGVLAANVALRVLTKGPVAILTDAATEP